MKIKINRTTPITQQLAQAGIGFAPREGSPLPPDAGLKIVDEDSRSVSLEEINLNDIVFNLYLGMDHLCDGDERIEYLKKRTKKLVRLDAGIGMELIRNANSIPLTWGRDENNDPVTFFFCDGTIFSEDDGNKYVLQILRDLDSGVWEANLCHLSEDSETPTAVLEK